MKQYVLALDQGTTSSRAILFDGGPNILAVSQQEFTQIYPRAGYIEHDPVEILSTQHGQMMAVVKKAGIKPQDIAAVGVTNQRETTILWDKQTGKPIYNAIVWQCRRTSGICRELEERGLRDYIHEATGLVIDAYFSGTKIKWILDFVEGARERAKRGEILFGTVDTWLIWNLTGGKVHATDYTNASRTMLYNIHSLDWDEKLLRELDIPREILPEVKNSCDHYGALEIDGVQIPITGVMGDQQAALFGQTCFARGEAKNTYGTGCFLLLNTGEAAVGGRNGLITTIAAGLNGRVTYALEGSVFVGGAVIQWLRDEMGLITEAKEVEEIAKTVPDNGGVYIVPAFTGLGAPHWDMYARGSIFGITRGTGRAHIIRAAQESIAYQVGDLLGAMVSDTGVALEYLNVDGGASRDSFLMQFQADITGLTLNRPVVRETTALGAAYLAGLGTGVWSSLEEIKKLRQMDAVFAPAMERRQREALLEDWNRAVGRTLGWIPRPECAADIV